MKASLDGDEEAWLDIVTNANTILNITNDEEFRFGSCCSSLNLTGAGQELHRAVRRDATFPSVFRHP